MQVSCLHKFYTHLATVSPHHLSCVTQDGGRRVPARINCTCWIATENSPLVCTVVSPFTACSTCLTARFVSRSLHLHHCTEGAPSPLLLSRESTTASPQPHHAYLNTRLRTLNYLRSVSLQARHHKTKAFASHLQPYKMAVRGRGRGQRGHRGRERGRGGAPT